MVEESRERQGGASPPNLLLAPSARRLGLPGSGARKPPNQLLADCPSVTAVPSPGISVMTRNPASEKFFLNLCKLAEVPPPAAMETAELEGMIMEKKYCRLPGVPMAVGPPRQERDAAGAMYWAAEVAVNAS